MTSLSPETQFLIDFNVADVAAVLGVPIPAASAAAVYGINEADLAAYAAEVETLVQEVAAAYLARPDTQRMLDRLSLPPGSLALTVGDSITTYRAGYARILHHLLSARGVELFNAGYSGHTSTHGLELTFTQHLARAPKLVFVKLGVNDTKRFGAGEKTLVSLGEYRANLAGIIQAFQTHCHARVIVLTPTLVAEDIVNTAPAIVGMHLYWRNADLNAFAAVARQVAHDTGSTCVDLAATLGDPPDPGLLLADGLHPNAAGHQRILEALISTLGF
jgi:lysophospholipase L1-like esterase